jgi:hypothetical protein
MKELATRYPEAKKSRLVQDNLKLGQKSGEWQNLIVFATLWSYGYQPNSNPRLLVAFDSTGR